MSPALDTLRKTDASMKHVIGLRVIAGAPLAFFGLMHLIGAMPMRPLVEAAGLPAPGLMSVLAPIAQLLAGLLLLSGAFVRVGALLAIGTMVGAIITHLKIPNDQWPVATTDAAQGPWPEPVFLMYVAIAIVLLSAYVLWRGSGAWGLDARGEVGAAPQPA